MMTMTTSNSTKVKPRPICNFCFIGLSYVFVFVMGNDYPG